MTTFSTIGRGSVANDGLGDTPYVGAGKINALIRAANAGQLSGFRNKLINGAFQVWQRGTSFASAAKFYGPDRWAVITSAVAGRTVSRQTGFSGAQYCCRVARDSANALTTYFGISQQIETADFYALQGKTVRVSADIRAGANFSASGGVVTLGLYTGTAADEAFVTYFPTGGASSFSNQAITTTAQRITFAAMTIPSDALSGALMIYCTPTGTAGAADYFEITNVQIEIVDATDTTATVFESRPFSEELRMCMRFYEKSFELATTPAQNVGSFSGCAWNTITVAGANPVHIPVPFRVRKRVAPTITLYNPAAANAQARNASTSADLASTTASNVSENGFRVGATGDASGADGHYAGVHWAASAEH